MHPAITDSYSKCNAELGQTTLTYAASTDSMRTFFLFLTLAFNSLHENAPASAKFYRNGRSPGGAREDGSNLRQNLTVFDQNLAVFGGWKGGSPNLHPNLSSYRAGSETGVPPEISSDPSESMTCKFHFLVFVSGCLVLSHSCVFLRAQPFFSVKKRRLGVSDYRANPRVSHFDLLQGGRPDHRLTEPEVTAPSYNLIKAGPP
jgi:hypothetical protein